VSIEHTLFTTNNKKKATFYITEIFTRHSNMSIEGKFAKVNNEEKNDEKYRKRKYENNLKQYKGEGKKTIRRLNIR